MFHEEMLKHLEDVILPYWINLIDLEWGGFYGYVNFNLEVDKTAEKGVILHSRILWFFAKAYLVTGNEELLSYANHAYHFLVEKCMDQVDGGVFWMLNYDGSVKESMKHTYNQAFAIYALAAYYEVSKKQEALQHAMNIFHLIENICTDSYGYLEAFSRDWTVIENEKLSENGLLADKTMNTLLHVLEAYTQLYEITKNQDVGLRLIHLLDIFKTKVYNPKKQRLEVFFDKDMNSISDLHSYGHDIEASWLLDKACSVLEDEKIIKETRSYSDILAEHVAYEAVEHGAVNNECFRGVVDKTKIWWVQAEAVVGFYNAFEKTKDQTYLKLSHQIWDYIKENFVDRRDGGEWFWDLDQEGIPVSRKPITEPWKCPYHNGRMCFEIVRRMKNV